MFDPITLLAGLGPIVTDLGKSLINRYVAPDTFKPATIEQYVKMKQIDLDMFKAMNDAGGGNASYPWVEAVVRLMRPTIGLLVLGTWVIMHLNGTATDEVNNFASAVGFYLFAERSLFYAKKK
jgi:hypothetical protein